VTQSSTWTANDYTRANEDGISSLSFNLCPDWFITPVRASAAELAASLLLLLMAVTLVAVTARKSITNDEIVMIPAAYNHVTFKGNNRSVREHPPALKIFSPVPLLFIQPNEAPSEATDATVSDGGQVGRSSEIWGENPAIFESLSFWPRLPLSL